MQRLLLVYRRRWKIERTVSWLHGFRRLVVHKFYSSIYHGFAILACLVRAVRRL